jgi:GT2 family glycosyltransferase
MYYWAHDQTREVDVVVGCCMLIPRAALIRVGNFDPWFFVYSEEVDLCRRMKDYGLKVVFTPDFEIIHYGGQTSKQMPIKMAVVQLDSKIKYFYKHRGAFGALMLRAIFGAGACLRLLGWCIVYLSNAKTRVLAWGKIQEQLASMRLVASWKPELVG